MIPQTTIRIVNYHSAAPEYQALSKHGCLRSCADPQYFPFTSLPLFSPGLPGLSAQRGTIWICIFVSPEPELHWECHCISQSFFWPTQWPVLSLHFWPSLHNQDIPGYCLLSGSSLWVPLCFPVVMKFLASALSSFLQEFIHSFMWLQPLSQNLNLNTFPWNHS